MKNVLISGSTGGIGEHLCLALNDYRIFTISRRESKDSLVYACDLARDMPVLKDSSYSIDWIVHLATSYKIKDDLAMLRHLLDFAREHQVKNIVYTSSWVIHFPSKPIKQEYVTMKRACERELDQARDWLNVYIVRPAWLSAVTSSGMGFYARYQAFTR
jgi:nucleoside-diphosphate-sugar epimerase